MSHPRVSSSREAGLTRSTPTKSDDQPMTYMNYRNVQVAIVVHDLTQATICEKVKTWVNELQRQANHAIPITLAGNKILVDHQPIVDGRPCAETSAPSCYGPIPPSINLVKFILRLSRAIHSS